MVQGIKGDKGDPGSEVLAPRQRIPHVDLRTQGQVPIPGGRRRAWRLRIGCPASTECGDTADRMPAGLKPVFLVVDVQNLIGPDGKIIGKYSRSEEARADLDKFVQK